MSTFIEESHPEAHAKTVVASPRLEGDTLRTAIKATGLSNARLAAAIGKSETTISQWLNAKYPGDNSRLENLLREWQGDRQKAALTGVATIQTKLSEVMAKRMEEIRKARELSLFLGEAGIGKSRGINSFMLDHAMAMSYRTLSWNRGMRAFGNALLSASDINRLPRGKTCWEFLDEKLDGCERLLVIDDAHELSSGCLQCLVDLQDETHMPMVMVGLPKLRKLLLRDARRASRVGDVFELDYGDPEPLVRHQVRQICPTANGEHGGLVKLGLQVAQQDGHFRSLEKELLKTARKIAKKPGSWVEAFKASHGQLLRPHPLN